MLSGSSYERDQEFQKLLRGERDIDLVTAALEIARDAFPNLEFSATFDWIRQRSDELMPAVTRVRSEVAALDELTHSLAEAWGLHGDEACYNQADSSYLNRVVETQKGIPITLSLVYMAVADRLGIELSGVASPMHFLTRLDAAEGTYFVDAYSFGRILTETECIDWLSSVSGLSETELRPGLQPAVPRTILLRMLANLKALHARQGNWDQAWLVQHRLVALEPSSWIARRDLALISIRANRPGQAVDLLEWCLKSCPDNERSLLDQHLGEAERRLSDLN